MRLKLKGEKAGEPLKQIFRSVIDKADMIDNVHSKCRSIMLKSMAGKRDIGQCEVHKKHCNFT